MNKSFNDFDDDLFISNPRTGLPMVNIPLTLASKLLHPGLGRKALKDFLVAHGIVMRTGEPYQKYMRRGYFQVIAVITNHKSGATNTIVRFTPAGFKYVQKLFRQEQDIFTGLLPRITIFSAN